MAIDSSGVGPPNNSLVKITLSRKVYRTTDSENRLPVSVISLMYHFISYLRPALRLFLLLVRLYHENIPSIVHTYKCV